MTVDSTNASEGTPCSDCGRNTLWLPIQWVEDGIICLPCAAKRNPRPSGWWGVSKEEYGKVRDRLATLADAYQLLRYLFTDTVPGEDKSAYRRWEELDKQLDVTNKSAPSPWKYVSPEAIAALELSEDERRRVEEYLDDPIGSWIRRKLREGEG